MIGELPYDGTASNLVDGLDALTILFLQARERRRSLNINSNRVKFSLSTQQKAYFEEVSNRIRVAQDRVAQTIKRFPVTKHGNFRNFRGVLRAITRYNNYGQKLQKVTAAKDYGFCIGFKASHEKNVLGSVDGITRGTYHIFAPPSQMPELAEAYLLDMANKFDFMPLSSKEIKEMTQEQNKPLFFSHVTKAQHHRITKTKTKPHDLLDAIFGESVDREFKNTINHELRHLQDVILDVDHLHGELNFPFFSETQAYAYCEKPFHGLTIDYEDFNNLLTQKRAYSLERLTNNKNSIQTITEINATIIKKCNATEQKVNAVVPPIKLLLEQEVITNPKQNLFLQPENAKSISYIFSTTEFAQIPQRLKLALDFCRQNPDQRRERYLDASYLHYL